MYTLLPVHPYRIIEENKQWLDSGNPAIRECTTSVQSVCPKYLNEVAVLTQCTTAPVLMFALYGVAIPVVIQ